MASTQDIDTLIARAKEEAGLAIFNKDAVERENALYQQQEEASKITGRNYRVGERNNIFREETKKQYFDVEANTTGNEACQR